MSRQIIGDELWAELTDGERVEAVNTGRATLKQISEGLLDGSSELRTACRDFLAQTDQALGNLSPKIETQAEAQELNELAEELTRAARQHKEQRHHAKAKHSSGKQRFGLPQGFVPRMQRYGRGVLLELNLYRLPDGQEFIPCRPGGTLGGRQHLYALVTAEQYLKGKRGSVYIRTDGRVFDYAVVPQQPGGDLFDTGYTIYDLERTGRYAPELRRKKKKSQAPKVRRAVAGTNRS
ncbi:MAG TPA: hypothetical protein VJT50_08185 [Pyrinomonadaceae bacterium]|nr:hypothetical protein [Pyrinomonadaceae bacterium]